MKFDVIVVLGAALGPDGTLGPALAERVEMGVIAWKRGYAPWLLMTGEREASAMREVAISSGVPADQILVEHQARTTRENAIYSGALLRERGLRRALVVTQPYHRARAVAAFRRVGVEAEALEFWSRRQTPRQQARELVARAVYRVRGWI
jgi:uncharacterized SAM-binding protein YcdF (DUF218 family)